MHGLAQPLSPVTPVDATRPPIDLQPTSAYEALTRQQVESLAEDMKEIKTRLNNIFYLVVGSILVDMIVRWMGG